jgi:hypothetical protein
MTDDFNSVSVRADTITGDLIPASDARLAVALAYQRVLVILENWLIGTDAMDEILAHAPADDLAEVEALRKWAALGMAVMEGWPEGGDLDGFQLQEMAEKAGVLYPVPGGFDPAVHTDQYGGAEPGDDWFMIIPRAALTPKGDAE